ncbi:hypothetical protein [Staphylococcus schleiferi]|uniref:Uncharacterized protein n=1 Tax=Staphylococcus schleiferi TaxID=1295 RepID=A0A7Z7QPT3_STASC|nr:hypothetical protein [Staphylococcus schleiferi]QGS45332.1 hypothetical protein FOB90_00855 [Mammaliicoccus fleurettii]NHA34030.1 hypothetical protein [Staphylococcus schleiferi]NHA38631.1 hypothetical protein [Staphylococcus schleiferi]NHA40794.1 hypothetical protein [Staphylococcus schleiferi]RTX77646.1 hypothetical protein CD142_10910 [Staphylococcus schleiferi subsp. schleiferi]
MNALVNLGERIIQLEKESDSLITDVANLRNQRDKLQRKLDEVVELFNTHLAYKKAWSDNPYYDKLENELNRILEDE